MRRCHKCGIKKPLDRFNVNRSSPDGLTNRCAECNREACRSYRQRAAAKRLAYNRAYRAANRERCNQWASDRFHRVRSNVYELVDRKAVYVRDAGTCYLCQQPVDEDSWTLDHIMPVVAGGPHVAANVAVTHRACNGRKAARLRLEAVPTIWLHALHYLGLGVPNEIEFVPMGGNQ